MARHRASQGEKMRKAKYTISNEIIKEAVDNNEIDEDDLLGNILNNYPIYDDNSSIEDMNENNKRFYEEATKSAFKVAFRKEQEQLNELVETTYYPEKKEEELTDFQLMKNNLNLV
jgi:hypothetical protein